jgi:PPOX class probable F420-dependent enzyme
MSAELTYQAKQIIEQPVIAHLATVFGDCSPQVTPVWVDHDGRNILVNTEATRLKVRNIRRHPKVALSILDPTHTQARLLIRGEVVEMTEEGAWEHIRKLARKYTEYDYPETPGQTRLILKIRPTHIRFSTVWA